VLASARITLMIQHAADDQLANLVL